MIYDLLHNIGKLMQVNDRLVNFVKPSIDNEMKNHKLGKKLEWVD